VVKEIIQGSTHQPAALAVPLAKLSVAHYRDGNWKQSAKTANELLQLEKIPQWDGMYIKWQLACGNVWYYCLNKFSQKGSIKSSTLSLQAAWTGFDPY